MSNSIKTNQLNILKLNNKTYIPFKLQTKYDTRWII